jgi:hypothetical protein
MEALALLDFPHGSKVSKRERPLMNKVEAVCPFSGGLM